MKTQPEEINTRRQSLRVQETQSRWRFRNNRSGLFKQNILRN